jgi:hypothetical protein
MLPKAYHRAVADLPGVRDAARNNAEWCDAFCRTHGIHGRFDEGLWSSATRTPPLYPDAVTLRPGLTVETLLPRIDAGPGSSVKDSFADLDLAAMGFDVLFQAEWLCQAAGPAETAGWAKVADAAGLERWQRASGGTGDSFFRPELLDHATVAMLARSEGDAVVAAAVANRSSGLIGLTNVFRADGDVEAAFAEAAAAARACFGSLPVVCFEHGELLEAAGRAGFAALGELVVWASPLE